MLLFIKGLTSCWWQVEALLLQVIIRCHRVNTKSFASSQFCASVITCTYATLLNLTFRRRHTPRTALLRLAYASSHLLKFVMLALKVAVLRLLPIIRRAPPSVMIPVLQLPLHFAFLSVFELALRNDVGSFNLYLSVHPQIIQQLLFLNREERAADRCVNWRPVFTTHKLLVIHIHNRHREA